MSVPTRNPTYLLAPNWNFRPGGPISLGNIITNPFKPHIVLSKPNPDGTIPETATAQERDWKLTVESGRNLNVNLWLTFLEGIGIKLATNHEDQLNTPYATATLETVYFKDGVTTELIGERIKDPTVTEILKPNYFLSKPVYMITGVKIAKGLQLSSQTSRTYESSSDNELVFAYQLLKISPPGWGNNKTAKLAEYKSSATLRGSGGDDGDVTVGFEASYFTTMDQNDNSNRPRNITIKKTKDNAGNAINVFAWENEFIDHGRFGHDSMFVDTWK